MHHANSQSPDATFSPLGFRAASDAAKIDTGLKFDLTGCIALFAQFDGEFSGQSQSYGGQCRSQDQVVIRTTDGGRISNDLS